MNKFYIKTFLTFLFLLANLYSQQNNTLLQKESVISENIILVGNYFPTKGEKKLFFVLLHGLGSGKEEWSKLETILEKEGWGYFAFDLRGHNESVKTTDEKTITYNNFTSVEWKKMVSDLDNVIKYLKNKSINEEYIVLVGASLGANISMLYSAKNKKIKTLILLSPGWNYANLEPQKILKDISRKNIFIAASPQDYYSYSSCRQFIKTLTSYGAKPFFVEGKGTQHGIEMFKKDFLEKISSWIKTIY